MHNRILFLVSMKKLFLLSALLLSNAAYNFLSAQTSILYATTLNGGVNGTGAIVSYNLNTRTETLEWSFGNGNDGKSPYGTMVYDTLTGLLLGTTKDGGDSNRGTIFAFDTLTKTDTVLWSFKGGVGDGALPYGNPVYNPVNHQYYIMTGIGGAYGTGTIVSYNLTTHTEALVWSFGSNNGVEEPIGDLWFDRRDSLFYGLIYMGGGPGVGGIVSFNPVKDTAITLFQFNGTNGRNPWAGFVYNSADSLLYGTTLEGGSSPTKGTIISFNTHTNVEKVVWNFGSDSYGFGPEGNLAYYPENGLYYLVTTDGGTHSGGTLGEFNAVKDSEKLVWSFGAGTDGLVPVGTPVYNPGDSLLYLMAFMGGGNNKGAIISYKPATNSENVIWSLGGGTDGANPQGNFTLLQKNNITTSLRQQIASANLLTVYPNPSNGLFTISMKNEELKMKTIAVYNVLGEQIYSAPFTIYNSQFTIDLSSNPNGSYFLRVITADGETFTQKVSVVR